MGVGTGGGGGGGGGEIISIKTASEREFIMRIFPLFDIGTLFGFKSDTKYVILHIDIL